MTDPVTADSSVAACATIDQIVAQARRNLQDGPWGYIAAAAGGERSVANNRDALDRIRLLPRVLRDVSTIDISTTVMGVDLDLPVMCSPVGSLAAFHPDGAAAAAKGAAAEGTIAFVGMLSSVPLSEVQAVSGARNVLQLYVSGDVEWTDAILDRVLRTDVRGICVTVDSPVHGRRNRLLEGGFDARIEREGVPPLLEGLGRERIWQARFTWELLERIRQRVDIPLAVKGILHPEDARRAVELGVDAIYVSNHGGRELDHAVAAIDQLPSIVTAVDGNAQVLFDSGIRSGTDVLKAIGLGADAVLIGRLQCWGLAAGGAEGVQRVLAILRAELLSAMAMCGATSLADLPAAVVPPLIAQTTAD